MEDQHFRDSYNDCAANVVDVVTVGGKNGPKWFDSTWDMRIIEKFMKLYEIEGFYDDPNAQKEWMCFYK